MNVRFLPTVLASLALVTAPAWTIAAPATPDHPTASSTDLAGAREPKPTSRHPSRRDSGRHESAHARTAFSSQNGISISRNIAAAVARYS